MRLGSQSVYDVDSHPYKCAYIAHCLISISYVCLKLPLPFRTRCLQLVTVFIYCLCCSQKEKGSVSLSLSLLLDNPRQRLYR